jgi:polyisoprenoid-binding protein YceI
MRRAAVVTGVVLASVVALSRLATSSAQTTQAAPGSNLTFDLESKVWVEGTSTVKAYKCVAKSIGAALETGPEGQTADVAQLVKSALVTVATGTLECGNGTMNEHMRKALKLNEHPNVAFTLDSYALTPDGLLKGKLQIAGQEKEVLFPATITEENGAIRVAGKKQINMKEWGVKPPSLMLGTMKVNEMVTINFDVIVKR